MCYFEIVRSFRKFSLNDTHLRIRIYSDWEICKMWYDTILPQNVHHSDKFPSLTPSTILPIRELIQLSGKYFHKSKTFPHPAINNVCNFLMTLNAACNFLLYCALSDKYRKTVKELFLGRKMRRQNTMSSTYFSRYGSNPTGSSFYSKSPTNAGSASSNNIRNRSMNPKKSRFSITPTDYANFQAEMAVKNAKTQSLAAADFQTESNRRQNSVL